MSKLVFSIIESPAHPNLTGLLEAAGYKERQFVSVRKAMSGLKKEKPDIIIADFIYAYLTNYDSNHKCNLDSLLVTLQRKGEVKPRFIFLADKSELAYVDEVAEHYKGFCDAYSLIPYPVSAQDVVEVL